MCFQVFRKVEKQLPQLTTLDLQYVSPQLLKARNLDLAMPGMHLLIYTLVVVQLNRRCILGTYQSGRPVVRIASFATKLTVIASKQRPRRLSLKGSDGQDYQYGLKGTRIICPILL
jgi:FKBP12-rapamycin complex-associated protein